MSPTLHREGANSWHLPNAESATALLQSHAHLPVIVVLIYTGLPFHIYKLPLGCTHKCDDQESSTHINLLSNNSLICISWQFERVG